MPGNAAHITPHFQLDGPTTASQSKLNPSAMYEVTGGGLGGVIWLFLGGTDMFA